MDKQTLNDMVDGNVTTEQLRNDILPDPKDPDRFQAMREVLQERVEWDEPILVPLNDHLFAVNKDGEHHIKAECGHEFGPLDDNWKTECRVRVREDKDEYNELYMEMMSPNPEWTFQLREFICPECYEIVDVDAVPAGYPAYKPFEPDIDTFYEEWIEEPVPE